MTKVRMGDRPRGQYIAHKYSLKTDLVSWPQMGRSSWNRWRTNHQPRLACGAETTYQMQVLSKTEQPDSRVPDGLLESLPSGSFLLNIDSVSEESSVCELLLFLIEPLGSEGSVGSEGQPFAHVQRRLTHRNGHAQRATRPVTAPWMMKSHRQPAMPRTPSSSKIPAAIKPAKAVARMFPTRQMRPEVV